MASLVAEGLGSLTHQILYVSSVYPEELFELAPFGSFRYRKSRHPDLNKYIDQIVESLQVLLSAVAQTIETVSIAVLDDGDLVAEWIVDLMVKDVKNINGEIYRSWIGSIAVKMQQMTICMPPAADSSSRTFSVNTGLKQSLSTFRLGAGLDWVLTDTKPDDLGSATIYPCKSFRAPQIAVLTNAVKTQILYFIDECISQGLPSTALISTVLWILLDGSKRTIFWVVVEYGTYRCGVPV